MSGSWIAGSVRARLLVAERRLGAEDVGRLAGCSSLHDALAALGGGPYRHGMRLDLPLTDAQRAVASKTLLDLRLLAGWLPGDALELLRALAAWFELCNLEDRVAYLVGASLRPPFELGLLGVAWPRARESQTVGELRRAIAASQWRDPGGDTPARICLGLRFAWARRAAAAAGAARAWAAGAAALLLARELFVVGMPVEAPGLPRLGLLGSGWRTAGTFERFLGSLPPEASWALTGIGEPRELWQAEARWWTRVEDDAERFIHEHDARRVVVGATALLGADARRISAALAVAARRGLPGFEEVPVARV